MNLPKISIITVVYNDCKHIKSTINNVSKQTYLNLEYIVIDGESYDGTREIIIQNDHKISKWISEPDKGIYDAMNKGTNLATGEWILFRNCGDFFEHPTAIEKVFSKYIDEGEDFILCDIRYFKSYGFKDIKPNILKYHYFEAMPVNHPATFIRRTTQIKYPFKIQYKNSADYCFFIEALKDGAKYKYIPILLSLFDNNAGISTDHYDNSIRENIDIMNMHNAPKVIIDKLERIHTKILLKNKLRRFIPFYSLYHTLNLRKQGWHKCDLAKTLRNI